MSGDPQQIMRLMQEGVALHQAGQLDAAEKIYDKALRKNPRDPNALNLKGLIAEAKGRTTEALQLLNRAIAAAPDFPDAHFNKGNLLSGMGRLEEALATFAKAIALRADYADARLNAGLALDKLGQRDKAIGAFRAMTNACPTDPRGYYNLGVCLTDLVGQQAVDQQTALAEEARAALLRALALDPSDPAIPYALANLVVHFGEHDAALAYGRQAIALRPDWSDAWNNLANHLDAAGDRNGALGALDRALELDRANAGAVVNRGMVKLALGDFSEGWAGYARRFEDPRFPFHARHWPWPAWQGEDLTGKSILLWSDQGIGDEILYGSMISAAATQAATCVVECSPRLVTLYRRSFAVEVVARDPAGEAALRGRHFDFHCSVLDAGRWLRRSFTAFPNRLCWLRPDPDLVAHFRAAYHQPGKRRVGISWRSANPKIGREKSFPLRDFAAVLGVSSATFVNLQYGDCSAELTAIEATAPAPLHDPSVDSLADLERFAAQIASLDLVITVSNSTAHLAGALGVPTWVLVPDGRKRLWYWFTRGAFSPWYPAARLFREPGQRGIVEMAEELGRIGAGVSSFP